MSHCQLPEDLLADNLSPMALQFEAVLVDSPEVIEIDASFLEHADTAGTQLLCAFARDVRLAGKRVQWQGLQPHIIETANLLGMAGKLGVGQA